MYFIRGSRFWIPEHSKQHTYRIVLPNSSPIWETLAPRCSTKQYVLYSLGFCNCCGFQHCDSCAGEGSSRSSFDIPIRKRSCSRLLRSCFRDECSCISHPKLRTWDVIFHENVIERGNRFIYYHSYHILGRYN